MKLSWSWPKHLKIEHSNSRTPINKQIVKGYNIAYRLVPDQPAALDTNKNNNSSNLDKTSIQPSATLINKRNGQQSKSIITDSPDAQNKNQNFIVKSIESSEQDKERFVLLGLRKHSKYEVKVQAYNSGMLNVLNQNF